MIGPEIWVLSAICTALGFGFGWGLGRFLSATLLYLLWIGLAVTDAVFLWPALENALGLREGGWHVLGYTVMAIFFASPALVGSLIGGWIGLRQKARVSQQD